MNTDISNILNKHLGSLQSNTIVITNTENLNVGSIGDGVIIVLAVWSGPAHANCIATIKELYNQNYTGQIFVIDNDCMLDNEFQLVTFGQVCHGWGEIFIVKAGQIIQQFRTRDSFEKFKVYNDE
jgi:hypothetical protein